MWGLVLIEPGEEGLVNAFRDYVFEVEKGGVPGDVWEVGFFSYLLTRKQIDHVKKICRQQRWPIPKNLKGITIKGDFIKHVLNSRTSKDELTAAECADILSKSFHKNGEVGVNVKHQNQGVILNSKNRVNVRGNSRYSMTIFNVEGDNLSPVTAYDADRAKINSIKNR